MSVAAELPKTPSQPPAAPAVTTSEPKMPELEAETAAVKPAPAPSKPACEEAPAAQPALKSLPDVKTHLWQTFRKELTGRTVHLRELFRQAVEGERSDDLYHELARTLHTVKSASMVIPVEQVASCTHMAENLLAAAKANRQTWPETPFTHYAEWLESLTSAADDLADVLAAGPAVEAELHGAVN